MNRPGWLGRHGPFLVLMAFLFLAAYYVDVYLDAFAYVLANSRLFFQLFVGITLIAFLKNVVGVRTFGTFAPAIVALAFLQAGLLFGTLLLLNLLVIVIATRELVRRELIQQDHRVAILVVMVGLTIVLIEVLAEYFHFPQFDYTFLFPVLILAWTAERFVEEIDRTGWEDPSRKLLWTFLTIFAAYLAMRQDWLVDFLIRNPLTWPLLVLANWYLGTRVRFRLAERRRFRPTTTASAKASAKDVLTMNVRNREYLAKYNDPSLFPGLTKARAKDLLASHGVPVPATYLVVRHRDELPELETFLATADAFVLKPAAGHGGEGILVVRGRDGKQFRTGHGPMSAAEIVAHAQYVLTGAFADPSADFADGGADEVLVEALVEPHEAMRRLAPDGLADVRVISFLGFPVMAMVRLPTKESEGRANLHAGAVGCGVQLSLGRIVHATWHGRRVHRHPDTGVRLVGAAVPFWDDVLAIAAQAQVASGLGYAGVDVVLDATHGPLVLEVNKRPGLEIQNANRAGLLRRLRTIERLRRRGDVEDRVPAALALDLGNWEASA
jgi:alpha-L-glutamate ligase-like protein